MGKEKKEKPIKVKKDGIKENKDGKGTDAIDILCYVAIAILILIIVIPPVLRVIMPKEEVPVEPDKIVNLVCEKRVEEDGYALQQSITNTYTNDKITSSVFVYEVNGNGVEESTNVPSIEEVSEEFKSLIKIAGDNVQRNGNTATIRINYEDFENSKAAVLSNHQKPLNDQMNYYGENGFYCTTM